MCTHVDTENIPTQQITTVRAASTSPSHDCVCPPAACITPRRHCPRSSPRRPRHRPFRSSVRQCCSRRGSPSPFITSTLTDLTTATRRGPPGPPRRWPGCTSITLMPSARTLTTPSASSSAATTARAHLVSGQPTGYQPTTVTFSKHMCRREPINSVCVCVCVPLTVVSGLYQRHHMYFVL